MKHLFLIKMLVFLALGGLLVMLLWNAVMPSVVGLGSMSYLRALAFLVLCRILFGHFTDRKFYYKLHQAWGDLSPQERSRILSGRHSSLWDEREEPRDHCDWRPKGCWRGREGHDPEGRHGHSRGHGHGHGPGHGHEEGDGAGEERGGESGQREGGSRPDEKPGENAGGDK